MTTPAENDLYLEAIARCGEFFDRAQQTSAREPTAMALATADAQGLPAVRIVLLRGFSEAGFVFYTNTGSDKARDLAANPQAALCLYRDELTEQVRIQGAVDRVGDEEANAYWASRPRDNQIAAWASKQSQTLPDRQTLQRSVDHYERLFEGQPVPRPDFWTGYRLLPRRIEFWTGRPARLHERLLYERQEDGRWTKRQLYP